jgi:O-antigen ligase/polysaccharide polymerase Wzy-like membrane protein
LPALVTVTVFAFAAGSSSVPAVLHAGHKARWVALLVLLAAAAWRAPLARVPRGPALAAAAFVALAALSSAWSVAPRTTFAKAGSLALLFAACLLLAARPHLRRDLLWGVLAGAVAVALAGLLVLALAHGDAVVAASYEAPARFRGFGQDANTGALLFGVAAPLAVWALLTDRSRRAWAAASLLLLAGEIVASGSRGALGAAAAGSVVAVFCVAGRRRALALAAAVVAVAAVGAFIQSLPSPAASSRPPAAAPGPAPKPKPGYRDAEALYPLDGDVGRPLPGGGEPPVRRSFFGGSGRRAAWGGALHQAAQRPVVGHGFGTESRVFEDRYYTFVGGLPENSYIGLALQLGLAGLVAFAALLVALVRPALRHVAWSAPGLAVLAAGLVAALAQSYFYSVGNLAAAALWIPAFLAAGDDGR